MISYAAESWRFDIGAKISNMLQNWEIQESLWYSLLIHNTALQAMEVTYCAQLRISGKVGIILIPAEMPFTTSISTSSQSWLQKGFGEKKYKKKNISILRNTKLNAKEVRIPDSLFSLIMCVVSFPFPSNPFHSVGVPFSSLQYLLGLGEIHPDISIFLVLWLYISHVWSQPGFFSPNKIPSKLVKMSVLILFFQSLGFELQLI